MSEVLEGYKMTELGEIPTDWNVVRIGDICTVKSSKRVHQKDYVESGVPFYRSKEIKELSSNKQIKTELFISEKQFRDISEKFGVPSKGDVLITSVGTIGDTWIVDGRDFYYKDGNITQINHSENLKPEFIKYLFASEILKKQYLNQSSGSAQMALTIEKINKLKITYPPIKEQQKIAEILSIVDKQIEQTEQLIDKTKELKKGLMQQLLTKGIGHSEFQESQFGQIPRKWSIIKLGEKCKVKSSKRVHMSDYVEEGVPFYRSKEIKQLSKREKINTELYISRELFNKFKNKFGVPEKGDILITSVGTIGDIWVSDGRELYYKDGNLTQIDKNESLLSEFIKILFESEIVKKQYLNQSSGSAQMALTIEKINKLKVVLPPIEEQQKIVDILSTVDAEIESYEQEKAKYEELKKGLMQQLLTGKIRVIVD
ncbi:restriction endonuclease subunit S [Lysinibacillus xylanilyticus]|uniref:restriction endonuclease subunit S n=1 Tax=Lysinibacillus xylanilyticus TaxID=582475 RepID=UPI003D974612